MLNKKSWSLTPEWVTQPSIIKETRLRPDIMLHSASTQQLIMVELPVPYENIMEDAHIYKREKYMNLTKELENAGYKAVVMPVEIGARGFVGSSVYDLLTKLSKCGNKRTKALKLLAEIAENSSRWNPGAVQNKKDTWESWPGCGPAPLKCQKFDAEKIATRRVSSLKNLCYIARQWVSTCHSIHAFHLWNIFFQIGNWHFFSFLFFSDKQNLLGWWST